MRSFGSNSLTLSSHYSLYLRSLFNPLLFHKSLLLNDKWVSRAVYPGKRNGFFIEAGAGNGVFNSSCYALERHFGWRGICIEPHERLYRQCLRKRPGSTVINTALSDRNGSDVFVEAATSGFSGLKKNLQATEQMAQSEGWVKDQWRTGGPWIERQVETSTLRGLLKKHEVPATIDYIALDIEGAEYAALEDFPFDEYRVGCLSVEGALCDDLLEARGFVRVRNPYNGSGPWEHYFLHPDLVDFRTRAAPQPPVRR